MRPIRPSTVLMSLLVTLLSCTDTGLQRVPPPPEPELDNLIRVKGEFCTEPSAEITFPVKVLYIVDQSASLQCTDSQNRRFTALNSSINRLLSSQPNAQFGFIGFSSWAREQDFTRDRDAISQFVDPAGGLGPATDYQGAIATAVRLIERDILSVGGPERARTRYIINFVSDGNPEPRCNAGCEDTISDCSDGDDNDGDGRTDGADPDCANINDNSLHPDNLYGVCNTDLEIPDDAYVDFSGICPEYNQPMQIMQRVSELLELKDTYSVGDVTLNTVLLFSPQAVVEGICPGASTAFGYDKTIATALMQAMANEGNGTFRDVNLTTSEDFLTFDISSIKAELTLSSFVAYNEHARVGDKTLRPDSDADGLSDEEEILLNTDRNSKDSDGDNFGDLFETKLLTEGFDPRVAERPAIRCNSARDGDGDGLNDCEEEFLKTDPIQPDTDGDGVLDWTEMLYGTDPLVNDALSDLDFDGVVNGEEIKAGTDPLVPDADRYRDERIVYGLDDNGVMDVENPENGRMEERHCYDFDVRDIPMTVTPIPGQNGYNRILLYTSEKPSRVAGVSGEVRVACFEAFYGGGSVKEPQSGLVDITAQNLEFLRATMEAKNRELSQCPYFNTDQLVTRDQTEGFMQACMPPKIAINDRLYLRDDVRALLRKNFDGDNIPRLPIYGWQLFTPIQNFDPDRDCFRLWEYETVVSFFDEAVKACAACTPEAP
ncbi:MAG: VWA domain-containing protein [bacterium]